MLDSLQTSMGLSIQICRTLGTGTYGAISPESEDLARQVPVPWFILSEDELEHLTDQSVAGIIFLLPALLSAAKLVHGEPVAEKQIALLREQIDQIFPGASWKGMSFEIHLADYLRTIFTAHEQTAHSA